jgi:hypothetical protein
MFEVSTRWTRILNRKKPVQQHDAAFHGNAAARKERRRRLIEETPPALFSCL